MVLQISMKWMDQAQSNVNKNISLAQFSFTVSLMDSYSTDYYDIAYPGLIMKVRNIILLVWEHGAYSIILSKPQPQPQYNSIQPQL